MDYKLGSLFDGSGGFPLAGSLCGITPVWAAEVEPYPIAVTRSRFPGMRHLGDISKVNGAEIEPVDIITFGSPCQDLSVAGKRAGLKHEANGDDETTRSGLFMEAVRIIKEMRAATNGAYPRIALWENVPGAFSSNKGEDFRIVLQELIQIIEPGAVMPAVPKNGWAYADHYCGDGWSLAYRTFDAQYWGVPQRRRRIHLIVDFAGQCARNILFEREGVRGYFEAGRTPWQAAASHAERGAGAADCQGIGLDIYNLAVTGQGAASLTTATGQGASNTGPSVAVQYLFENHSQDSRYKGPLEVSPMLPAQLGTGGNNTPFVVMSTGQGKSEVGENCCTTLNCNHEQPIVAHVDCRNFRETPELYGTPQAKPNGGQSLNFLGAVRINYIVRRLTETECGRLQGFDRWGDIDEKDELTAEEFAFWQEVRNTHAAINGKAVKEYTEKQMQTWYKKLHTKSAEYKMWGNGIALPPALYCMQGIMDALEKEVARNDRDQT